METLFEFLARASAGITLLYIVYWTFLRNETFYRANRWFLLFALISAVLLSLFPLHYSVLVEPEKNTTIFQALNDTFKNIQPVQSEVSETNENFGWRNIILTIYITGTAIFLIRLLTQTVILIHLMFKCRIKSLDGIRIVENEKYGLPFSFFNIVFINPKFHTQASLPEILSHEKVHIREFHWFDLLFIELLTVIFWFNPFIWFFEHAIKQNHEYLADQGVLAQGHSVARYQALLINQLMGMQIIGITNNLNFALNTNRFKMMTKKKTSASRRIKFAWALPAIALLLFAFAEPNYLSNEVSNQVQKDSNETAPAEKTVKIVGLVLDEANEALPGTSIVIKGSTVGTVSDSNGKFELEVPEKSSIVLSFVGKETLVEHYTQITSGELKEGAFYKKYVLKDAVILLGPGTLFSQPPKAKGGKDKLVPPPPPPPPVAKIGDKEVFYVVEDLPQYPGGSEALSSFVFEMQQKLAQEKGIKGKGKVAFTVNGKGKVTDIKIVEQDNEGVGKGAVTIVSEMKDWTPGKQRGKSVPVKYLMPVEF
ncbi:MAG TPA: M56 family metallopeptidase [Draconibacterium sp.]|nr:M56 family metallopeptidase [Draconibacterium sp.]